MTRIENRNKMVDDCKSDHNIDHGLPEGVIDFLFDVIYEDREFIKNLVDERSGYRMRMGQEIIKLGEIIKQKDRLIKKTDRAMSRVCTARPEDKDLINRMARRIFEQRQELKDKERVIQNLKYELNVKEEN